MRRRCLILVLVLAGAGFTTVNARADDSPTSTPKAPAATRIDLSASIGYVDFERSASDPSTQGGGAIGVDVHVHPGVEHGFFLSYVLGEGVFGPDVSIVSGGYSFLFLGTRELKGITGAGYLNLGPAVGVVSGMSPNHVVVGGHAALTFDAHVGSLSLGFSLAYDGGVPTGGVPDAWEGAILGMLRLGAVFDVGSPERADRR